MTRPVVPVRSCDVLIAGAGPVGLMLTVQLRRYGVRVVLAEQLDEPTGESRASQLNARTMEILDECGLLADFGPAPCERIGHFGGLPLDVGGVDSPYAGLWKVPQFRTESVLARRAVRAGVRIRRGHRVRAAVPEGDRVVVTVDGPSGPVRLRCRYLVGCDGGRSTVRELAGIALPGTDADRRLYRADVAGIDVPNRRFERTSAGLAVAARRPDGVTRVMVHEFSRPAGVPDEPPPFAEVVAAWRRVTGEDIAAGTPLWLDSFGDGSRLADRYRAGRMLIAGDAAHVHMPIGGHALNVGLHDAVNLGWKLAAVVRGRAVPGLLDSYGTERRPVAARVIADVDAQALLQLGGPEVEPARELVRELLDLPGVSARIADALSGVDVRYDVGADGGEHPLLGRRLPHEVLDTAAGPVPVAGLLRDGDPLLIDLSGPASGSVERDWAPWAGYVRRVPAAVRPGSALAGLPAVLVRPDGHVVAVSGAPRTALERWCGPPAQHPLISINGGSHG